MNVTMPMQDILATIQRNQAQIDLLTANNSQLTSFLLQQGLIQNLAEPAQGFRNDRGTPELFAHSGRVFALPLPGPAPVVSGPLHLQGRRGDAPQGPRERESSQLCRRTRMSRAASSRRT